MCHCGRDLSLLTECVSVSLSDLSPHLELLHHPGSVLLSLTCIPHKGDPLGNSQALSSFSLACDDTCVKVGMCASFGTLICAHTMMMKQDGKSFEIISQAGVAGGTRGLPLEAASTS